MIRMIRVLVLLLFLSGICKAQSIENLDIKNGFLQFHLGDSLSNYQSIIEPVKHKPGYFDVKRKFVKFKGYIDKVTLFFQNNQLLSIKLYISREPDERVIETAIKNCYGVSTEIKKGDEDNVGFHTTLNIWTGRRVALVIKKQIFNGTPGAVFLSGGWDEITFTKTSDESVDGTLSADFVL